jgi:putative ABC transport system substrate-binding protein
LIDSSNPGQTLPDRQMAAVLRHRAEALFVYPVPITPRDSERLAEFAVKNRLPTATVHQPFLRAGLLICYVTDVARQFHRAGIYIDKILKGAKPGDLPVEQAEKFELLINLKTAKALNMTIPRSLLLRADEVVE